MKKLAQGAVGTGAGTLLYTVPTAYRATLECIDVCNTTSGALTFSLHLVPSGGSVLASNMLFPAITVNAYTMVNWSGKQVLNAGDFVQAIGSGSGLTVNVTGTEERVVK